MVTYQASFRREIMNIPYKNTWTPEWLPLTEAQFCRIGRFWRAIKSMQNKINAAVNRASRYSWLDDWDEWDEWDRDEYYRITEVQKQLNEREVELQHDYDAFIAQIGFSRNDRSLPDHLFAWITNGVLILPSVRPGTERTAE